MSSKYLTITILSTLTIISKACNYVGFATFYNEEMQREETNRSPMPTNLCDTDRENATSVESEIILCAPWNEPVLFKFDTPDCTGGNPVIYQYKSGDYECQSSTPCNVFKVHNNPIESNNCVENTNTFEEFTVIADKCWVEQEGDQYVSIMATCDKTTGHVRYAQYQNVLDCSGDPTVEIDAVDGECPNVPSGDGQMSAAYFSLEACGQIEYPNTAPACSFIHGGSYTYSEGYWNNGQYYEQPKNRTMDNVRPMGFDTCTNELKDGLYSADIIFCSYDLNMVFYAQWRNLSAPSHCNTKPDDVFTIENWIEMECSPYIDGACDHVWLRTSEFEDDGTAECAFSDNWHETRIVTDKCWSMKDGGAKAQCSGDALTYTGYGSVADCESNSNPNVMMMESDECYDFESGPFAARVPGTPGNYSYFQALSCNGVALSNNQRPDCMYVENPTWQDMMGYEKRDNDGFKIPIGVCISEGSDIDERDESQMFICPPWGGVVMVEWDDLDCDLGSGEIVHVTGVEYSDENCQSDNYCDYVKVQANDASNSCMDNSTDFSEKAFVIDACTNGYKSDGINSINIQCTDATNAEDRTLSYNVFESKADCPGTASMVIDITKTQRCASFGEDPMFIEILECGAFVETQTTQCSYIVNPVYNSSDLGYEDRDGAFPLSVDLCLTNYNNQEGQTMSQMYACEPNSKLTFVAIWNNSANCDGKPDYVERIWSATGEMQCASKDVEDCDYTMVRTSHIEDINAECGPQQRIEESARIINMCWPDNEGGMSWQVDCAGDKVTVEIFNGASCQGTAYETINVGDNECTTGLDNGNNRTWFDVVSCTEPAEATVAPSVSPTDITTTEGGLCDPATFVPLWEHDTVCQLCICGIPESVGGNANELLNGLLDIYCDAIVASIPDEVKDDFMQFCKFEGVCEFDEVSAVQNTDKCDCDAFTCAATGDGNMLKVIVSMVFTLIMIAVY